MDLSERRELRQTLFQFAAAAISAAPPPARIVEFGLGRAAAALLHRHPDLAKGLRALPATRIAIDPTDLPYSVTVHVGAGPVRLRVSRTATTPPADAKISGTIAALTDLAEGRVDGDALFFSRLLAIEGKTEVVVELRNMLERAEIAVGPDLLAACAACAAAPGPARRLRRMAANLVAARLSPAP